MQKRVGNTWRGKIFVPKRQREERNEDTNTTKRKKMEETTVTALAEHPGYIIIKRKNERPPLETLIDELKSNIGPDIFEQKRREAHPSEPGHKVDGGEATARLLLHGVDVSVEERHQRFELTPSAFRSHVGWLLSQDPRLSL
jgi:hypothetical protein